MHYLTRAQWTMLRIVKILAAICHTYLTHPHTLYRTTQFDVLRPLSAKKEKPAVDPQV